VDALNPFQFFVLLDMEEKLFSLPSDTLRFIENMSRETTLSGRKLQIAKLGLHFLTIGIPSQSLSILQSPEFQILIHRGLASIQEQPSAWLARTKNNLMMFQQLNSLEEDIGVPCDWIWQPVTLIKIIQRILFDDSSRLTLVISVKSIHYDLIAGRISTSDCKALLHNFLVM
jgi:hypothetical protein